jgi:hypothetical protein
MTGTERSLARIDKSDLLRLAALAAEVEASQGLRCLVVLRGPRRPPFPYRWRGTADFGPAKLGRYPPDRVAARAVILISPVHAVGKCVLRPLPG